ncbi:hypothetical protein BEP19_02635 [Ammoniphilus oxalaticus]|uniref:Methyltransferase type 11 domain-containing protein n=1 Tax=Ammoniphilus oxalaticus TaxID=66863 RepID=A0A419SNI1_9BACL|nr:hypothetical protein [Ammoniphilus oxalaticus]RKD25848.1 hypothetical protein BEP19_02635 [Ammoniphilus oxalaticus]
MSAMKDRLKGDQVQATRSESELELHVNDHRELVNADLQQIITKIKYWKILTRPCKMLDLSHPYGLYAYEFSRLYTNVDATVLIDQAGRTFMNELIGRDKSAQKITVVNDGLSSLDPKSFDIVICSHTLYQHRKQLVPTLTEISNYIRSGGLLISNHYFCSPDCGEQDSGLDELGQSKKLFDHPLCDVERFREFIERSNFTIHRSGVYPSLFGDCHFEIAKKI